MLAEVVAAASTGAVITGWAVLLGCSAFQVGLVAALPYLSQMVQLPSAWISSAFGRRRVAVAAVTVQRGLLLLLAPLPFLPCAAAGKQALLIGVAGASAVLGVVGNNAWTSWMGDLVPAAIRGRYFGGRAAVCTAGGSLAGLGFGVLLDRCGGGPYAGASLAALAVLASLAGVASGVLMSRQHEPAAAAAAPDLGEALRPFRDGTARRLLAFQAAFNCVVAFGGGFFYLHLVQNLHVAYARIALHAAGVAGARMLSAPMWGRAVDRLGARPVLAACSFATGLMPFIWLSCGEQTLWPMAIDAMLGGAAWGGHALASFALPLAVAPRRGRPFYLAAFSMSGGVGYAAGAALGGAVAGLLPARFVFLGRGAFALQVLFVVSGLGRLAVGPLCLGIRERGAGSVWQLRALARSALADFRLRLGERMEALLRGAEEQGAGPA